ncbi:hypothetical protein Pint_05710 [Pistacia integerrima]|uniref:Uncharacterized protein n=1 Tax=Pistacia integerrima TaxID=434235 RepID=A0ACC0Z2V0_9ROSI|nr:hypothetical protein Pint_05710 [Pistacia integerrima]
MAVAAFKSSSKRQNLLSSSTKAATTTTSDKETAKKDSTKKAPPRRSRSVSAFSRTQLDVSASSSSNEFLIKRDNPLFCSGNSPPEDIKSSKLGEISPKKSKALSAEDTRRGRSVARNADGGKPGSGIGRSLSRVDTGRRFRSVSRPPVSRGPTVNSESEAEQEDSVSVKRSDRRKSELVKSSSPTLDENKSLRTPPGQRLAFEFSDRSTANLSSLRTPNWEDGVSTSSFSEAEEKTIKAVCEQMKPFQGDNLGVDTSSNGIYETVRSEVRRAIADIQNDLETAMKRNNTTGIAMTSVTDIPPDLVSPGTVELVLDIRREYAKKLEQVSPTLNTGLLQELRYTIFNVQSQERATKLRADLAVEEHRGVELSRILKEVLPDPKAPTGQKSRPGRKVGLFGTSAKLFYAFLTLSSIERRRMSRRLTDEAMAYFDECVSLSTFDSSDFSSQEDPPFNSVGVAAMAGDNTYLPHENSSVSTNYCPNSCLSDKQEGWLTRVRDAMELTASSSSKERIRDQDSVISTDKLEGRKFSFGLSPSDTLNFQPNIMKYVRNFEKDLEKVNSDPQIVTSKQHDLDEYNLQASSQSLLFDRVLLKNRLDSGSLLICGGGIAFSSSPSII